MHTYILSINQLSFPYYYCYYLLLSAVTIKFGQLHIDLVNLRTEEYSLTSRIPVIETGTPYQDAHRRDLTINSLFYNIHTKNIEDYTQKGLNDLKYGIVRTPLPALITLKDDPLRAYRIIRFACRFQYDIIEEVVQACRNIEVHHNIVEKVSRERIKDELLLMFSAPSSVRAIYLLYSYNLLSTLIDFTTNNIIKRKNSQSMIDYERHNNTPTASIPIVNLEKQVFIRNFFDIGVSTILISQYMRQFVLSCGDKMHWNCTKMYMNELATTGDLSKDFMYVLVFLISVYTMLLYIILCYCFVRFDTIYVLLLYIIVAMYVYYNYTSIYDIL